MPFPVWLHRFVPFGRRSEILGLNYLRSLGFRIVASPYRIRSGEVDIVAWDHDVLVFVEVKARQSSDPPEDAVGFHKRQRIIRAATDYRKRYRQWNSPCRFDILAIRSEHGKDPEFRLLRDAFHMYNSNSPRD